MSADRRPRRTCPACQRRYAGLVAPDCPLCAGLGVLALGAAALATHPPGAVARAVELYLEHKARTATTGLPFAEQREALEGAVLELRATGVLAGIADTGTPAHVMHADADARTVLELDAYRIASELGTPADPADLNSLAAPPIRDLRDARAPLEVLAHASANGHRARLALVADPIDPLGPDLAQLDADRHRLDHAGRVTAKAAEQLTRKASTR